MVSTDPVCPGCGHYLANLAHPHNCRPPATVWHDEEATSAAITQARREGAEEMRERAADLCHILAVQEPPSGAASALERVINTLPLPGDE